MKFTISTICVALVFSNLSFAANPKGFTFKENDAPAWPSDKPVSCKSLRSGFAKFSTSQKLWAKSPASQKEGSTPFSAGNLENSFGPKQKGLGPLSKGYRKLEDLAGAPISDLGSTAPKTVPCTERFFSGFDLEKSQFGFTQGFSPKECSEIPAIAWKSSKGERYHEEIPRLKGWNVGALWCSSGTLIMALEGSPRETYLQRGLAFWNLRTGEIQVVGDSELGLAPKLTPLLADLEPWRARADSDDLVELKGPDGRLLFSRKSRTYQVIEK